MRFIDIDNNIIIDAIKKNNSIRSTLLYLGVCDNGHNRKLLKKFAEDNNLQWNIDKVTPLSNIDKEELEKIVLNSNTYKEVINKLGYKDNGGGVYTTLKKKIKEFNIDTKHMTHSAKRFNKNIPENELFCLNSKHSHATIRRYIIGNNKVEYKCIYCGNKGVWMNKPLTLTLDHANGNRMDNRLENLRFVCPNCDRQQDTYGSKNKIRYFKKI